MLDEILKHCLNLHKLRTGIDFVQHLLIDNVPERHPDYPDKSPQPPAGLHGKALVMGKAGIQHIAYLGRGAGYLIGNIRPPQLHLPGLLLCQPCQDIILYQICNITAHTYTLFLKTN